MVAHCDLRIGQPVALVAHQKGRTPSERVARHRLGTLNNLHAAERAVAHVAHVRHRVRQLREVCEAQVARGALGAVRRELGRADDDDLTHAHRRGGAEELAEVLLLRDVVQHQQRDRARAILLAERLRLLLSEDEVRTRRARDVLVLRPRVRRRRRRRASSSAVRADDEGGDAGGEGCEHQALTIHRLAPAVPREARSVGSTRTGGSILHRCKDVPSIGSVRGFSRQRADVGPIS